MEPGRLLVAIDCTADYPPERYFACGLTEVIAGPAGRYRQAEARPLARFGYRFAVEHVGRPHLAVIRYPDDRRRFMLIMDGTEYDLSTGVITGGAQPHSGRLLELRQVFWPRWQDCSLVFTTWSTGEPAAAASFEIRELDGLPELEVPGDPCDGSRRQLGVQYEDPCGTGASEGALSKEEWAERIVAYMRHSGQGLLVYPLVWYHGPQYPSQREPADAFDTVVAPDRRQYARWTTHPPEWVAPLLDRLAAARLEFVASLTLLRLGSLMRRMNCDLAAIVAGADTINNMLWCDQVQTGTSDWTVVYNARNYPGLLEYHAAGKDQGDFPWMYGEKGGQHPGPIFNPLHPVVQEAVVGLVQEVVQRYGAFPAFRGLSLNLWHATIGWFASLRAGYDDYTTALFARETGIQIPVDDRAPDRFSRRHQYLTGVCRPAWIEWRCRKVQALVCRLRDVVVAARPDLRLTLTVWDETTVPQLLGWATGGHQHPARLSTLELYREGGIDLEQLGREPGVAVDLGLGNTRDRGGHPPDSTGGTAAPPEGASMYRDHDFLDRQTLTAMAELPDPGAFIFNCWVEAWGQHRWFPCAPDDAQAAALAVMSGQPAEGIFRLNSEYPEDGFWWDSQLRISPAFPAGDHFLEPYAHAVAELDARRITRGGLFLDKAHTELLQGFAPAYRSLPAVQFATVGSSTDPVAVRTVLHGGRRYLYLVNREYYPVEVRVRFSGRPIGLQDLATGEPIAAAADWEVVLGPYQLRALALCDQVGVDGFTATPPAPVAQALAEQVGQAAHDLALLAARGLALPGAEQLWRELPAALAAGRLAWVRRALHSYVVRKSRQLLSASG
jgi:hypothetical protein